MPLMLLPPLLLPFVADAVTEYARLPAAGGLCPLLIFFTRKKTAKPGPPGARETGPTRRACSREQLTPL